MKLSEAKSLKWGDHIKPAPLLRETFKTGKKVDGGIFLGLKKDGSNLLRVVTNDSSTVYNYHRDFWSTQSTNTSGKGNNESQ